jgi:hypothetical protein
MDADTMERPTISVKQLLILPKLFVILTVVFIMWIVIVLGGPMFGVFEPNWTGISPSVWMILISVLLVAFIIIDIVLYATPRFFSESKEMKTATGLVEFPEVEQRAGKQVYDFTYPAGSKGGVFSKTYVKISEQAIVRIRNQMIRKEEIWKE